MKQLGGQDAMFLWMETPRCAMHIGMIYLYDPSTAPGGEVSFENFYEHASSRMHTSHVFRQKVVEVPHDMDRPYWIEDGNFNVKNHVHCTTLPKPGTWSQLCTAITDLHQVPLDRSRPLWEMHMIQGLGKMDGLPNGGFAIFFKAHHAAIDGRLASSITDTFHSKTPEIVPPDPPTEEWVPEEEPKFSRIPGSKEILSNLNSAVNLFKSVLRVVPKMPKLIVGELSEMIKSKSLSTAPITRLSCEVSPYRMFDSRRFTLAEVKKMSKAVPGATINDIMLTVYGGVLRKYLLAKNDLPDKPLISMVPINSSDPDESSSAGNKVALMCVSLATDIDDPLERLHRIRENQLRAKDMVSIIGAKEITAINHNMPGALHSAMLKISNEIRLGSKSLVWNTIVSNNPGPRQQLYLHGAKLARMTATGPSIDGLVLGFPVFSYNGFIELSIIGCRKAIPDPEFVADLITESLMELKEALLPHEAADLNGKEKVEAAAEKISAAKNGAADAAKKPAAKKAPEKVVAKKPAATAKKTTVAKKPATATVKKTTAAKKPAKETAKKTTVAKKPATGEVYKVAPTKEEITAAASKKGSGLPRKR